MAEVLWVSIFGGMEYWNRNFACIEQPESFSAACYRGLLREKHVNYCMGPLTRYLDSEQCLQPFTPVV